MTRIATLLLFLSACASEAPPSTESDNADGGVLLAGALENASITEASGLARSILHDDRLWVINDGGSPAALYAIGYDGSDKGEVQLGDLFNVDWEDLSSFEYKGKPRILIADVGDNLALRSHVNLYVVDEPQQGQLSAGLSWQISLRFPDGPRDVEAVAVDPVEGVVYLLSKRTVPAELYSVPLGAPDESGSSVITATFLGLLESLPQPTPRDLDRALSELNWHWQPAGMAFSGDGQFAVVLTYRAVYLYSRQAGRSWLETLQTTPEVFSLAGVKDAEAITIAGDSIFVTVEATNAPLYRIVIER